ncbi:LOW QUALITY PROTEIN: ras GTPase-activating protein 2 [Rhincodon typus]|uniref:LOW QUALITY PROTEIN: ras GTPase-activating protein 2 n=1 Tax=Rhincodon typus TaxID=259920 RepID=UPI00202ED085|nr:LOW QUALITY PROTEIN: ras GTPase-activating protein 2 [Rhincodon typus]
MPEERLVLKRSDNKTKLICHKLFALFFHRVIECQGLPLVSGQSGDPYASVSLVGPSRLDQKRTKVKKKTSNPQFDETFYFEVTRNSSYTRKSHFQVEEENIEKLEIRVDLWNNENLVQDIFLGEIRVPVKILKNDNCHRAWYLLQPKDNGNKSAKSEDLGSLRLSISYNEDYVLPSKYYSSLNDLLLMSSDVKPISASAVHILGEVCREKQEAVLPLVRLLLHHKKLGPFLSAIAELDLQQTQEANTIFRGNTLATRCIDETMKLVGKHYLKVTLKSILDEICDSCKTCEIDPVKLKEGDNVEVNKENLRQYVERVFNVIVKSSMSCPTLMCEVFNSLQNLARKQFPDDPHVKYSAVSSFVFLRFFAVAVVSPHSFHLRPHHPDAQTTRVLTLISKTIQTLGSWGSLSKNKLSSFKESYMCDFFKLFQEEKCIESVKKTFASHIKYLLITNDFSNSAMQFISLADLGKESLYSILIKNIIAVEKLEERCFNRKNMFQVLSIERPERPLYVQAGNCVEANEWIEIITRVSRSNPERLHVYHPCAFISGSWICCKNTDEKAAGCTSCTGGSPANIQLAIDCDREAERIFSLFRANLPRLQKMEDACGSIDVYQGPQLEQDEYAHFTIEDSRVTFKTLQQIITVVNTLATFHEQYRIKRSTSAIYGSEENPIGAK